MIILKPSDYPVGTVIDVDEEHYERLEDLWTATDGHCVDCMAGDTLTIEEVDAKTDVRIISVPWKVTSRLVIMLQEEYGHVDGEGEYITLDSILKDVFEDMKEKK
jgi:hypothetical protein